MQTLRPRQKVFEEEQNTLHECEVQGHRRAQDQTQRAQTAHSQGADVPKGL